MKQIYINDDTKQYFAITETDYNEQNIMIQDLASDNIYIEQYTDNILKLIKKMFFKDFSEKEKFETYFMIQKEFSNNTNAIPNTVESLHKRWWLEEQDDSVSQYSPLKETNYNSLPIDFKDWLQDYIQMDFDDTIYLVSYNNSRNNNLYQFFINLQKIVPEFIFNEVSGYNYEFCYMLGYIDNKELHSFIKQRFTCEYLKQIIYDQWYSIYISNNDGELIEALDSMPESDFESSIDAYMLKKYDSRPARIKYI